MNHAQLVFDKGGKVLVPILDWMSFFAEIFKRPPAIKNLRHFRVSSLHPGIVSTQACSDSEEETHLILKHDVVVDAAELPNIIPTKGLLVPRQWYLFEKIRELCPIPTQDVTCPVPLYPRPVSRQNSPSPDSPPPPKKARKCGSCGNTGHTRRKCPTASQQ